MTPPRTLPGRAQELARALGNRPLPLAVAGMALIALGLIAAMTDHLGTALAAILLVQGAVLAVLMLSHRTHRRDVRALHDRLDRSDARIIGDLARLRNVLTDLKDVE